MVAAFDSDLGSDFLDATPNQIYETRVITLSGVSSPTDPADGVSYLDFDFCKLRYRETSSDDFSPYRTPTEMTNAGFSGGNLNGIADGFQVQFELTAPSTFSTIKVAKIFTIDNRHVSARATFGQVLLKTFANPDGTTATPSSGSTATFGLKVLNSDGVVIFGTNQRATNLGADSSVSISANSTSQQIFAEGMTATNVDEVAVTVTTSADNDDDDSVKTTINRSAGFFTITNNTASTLTATYKVIRY